MASSDARRYLYAILKVPVTNWGVEFAESYGKDADKTFWTGRIELVDRGLSDGVQVDRFHIEWIHGHGRKDSEFRAWKSGGTLDIWKGDEGVRKYLYSLAAGESAPESPRSNLHAERTAPSVPPLAPGKGRGGKRKRTTHEDERLGDEEGPAEFEPFNLMARKGFRQARRRGVWGERIKITRKKRTMNLSKTKRGMV